MYRARGERAFEAVERIQHGRQRLRGEQPLTLLLFLLGAPLVVGEVGHDPLPALHVVRRGVALDGEQTLQLGDPRVGLGALCWRGAIAGCVTFTGAPGVSGCVRLCCDVSLSLGARVGHYGLWRRLGIVLVSAHDSSPWNTSEYGMVGSFNIHIQVIRIIRIARLSLPSDSETSYRL